MKKFIAVTFSYVILGCGAVDNPRQGACIEQFRKERTDELKGVASKICEQTGLLNKDIVEDLDKCSAEATKKLIKIVSDIQDEVLFFGQDIPIVEQVKFIEATDGVLNLAHDLQDLRNYVPNSLDRQKEKFSRLKEKLERLDTTAKAFAKLAIEALPLNISSKEAVRAKDLYEQISRMNRDGIERCIKSSEELIIQFFVSTNRFKEILLLGCKPSKREQENLKLLQCNIATQNSYEGVLSIVGYPVFVLGIRSFMSSLVRVCEKNRKAGTAGEMIELRQIFRGEGEYALATVPSATSGSSSSSSSSQQTDTPANSPLFPQSSSSSGCPQASPTIALPFTPAVSQGDSQSQQLDNSAVSLSSKTDSSVGSSLLLKSDSFSLSEDKKIL